MPNTSPAQVVAAGGPSSSSSATPRAWSARNESFLAEQASGRPLEELLAAP